MDELPQNQLITEINHLKSEFRTIKNRQIVGTESQHPNRYFSEHSYDVATHASSFNTQQFRLSFTPDNAVQFQGLVYRLMYTVTASGPFFYEVSFVREMPVGNVQYWLFTIVSDPGSLYFKFYFSGASNGTIDAVGA